MTFFIGLLFVAAGLVLFITAKKTPDAINRNFRLIMSIWAGVFGSALIVPGRVVFEIGIAAVIALIIFVTYMTTKWFGGSKADAKEV